MKVLIAVVSMAVAVSARMAFELPNSADEYHLHGRVLDTSFSCLDRPYGYYADVENECAIFHVCQPVTSGIGELVETAHFSFVCGEGTVFSQSSLTCATLDTAYSCTDAPNIYDSSNSLFGITDISVADFRRIDFESLVAEAPVVESVDDVEAPIVPEVVDEAVLA